MEKLNFYGVGPKIARVFIPWLFLSIIFSFVFKHKFVFSDQGKTLFIIGLIITLTGLVLYFATLPLLLKGINDCRLVTQGAFSLCSNPLYSSIMLLIIPGTSLMINSWLVLTSSLIGYIMFKVNIKYEYKEMEKFFGEEYRKYRRETPEFFPLPLRKWFK